MSNTSNLDDNYLHLKYNITNINIIKNEIKPKLPNDIIELIWYYYISVPISKLLEEGLTEIVKYKLKDIYDTYNIEKTCNSLGIINYYTASCITDTCIRYGYLDLLKWLHYRNLTEYTYSIDLAAKIRNYEMLEWLNKIDNLNNYVLMCSSSSMDDAAIDGDLKLVEWLYNNRKEKFTEVAINYASKNGHFEIVKFLVDRYFDYTMEALEFACEEGHLNILNYLYNITYNPPKRSESVLDYSGSESLRGQRYFRVNKINRKCIINCIKNTHLHILEFIYKNEPILLKFYNKDIIETIENIKYSDKKLKIMDFIIKLK